MRYNFKYSFISMRDSLARFVKKNLFSIVVMGAFFLFGIVIGISVGIKAEDPKAAFFAANWLIANYSIKSMNLFFYLILKILVLILFGILFIIAAQNVYFSFIYYVVLFLAGLSYGSSLILLFRIFGMGALLIVLLGILVFELLYAAFLIIFAAHMFGCAVEKHKYGGQFDVKTCLSPVLHVLVFVAIVMIVQTLILFICSVFVL